MYGNNKVALPVTSVSLKTLLNNGNLPRWQMVTIVLPILWPRGRLSHITELPLRCRGGRGGLAVARGRLVGPWLSLTSETGAACSEAGC